MNILFIQASNIIGGAEMSLLDQVKYLSLNGATCFVVLKYSKKNILGILFEMETTARIFYLKSIPSIPYAKSPLSFLTELKISLYRFYINGPICVPSYFLKKIVKQHNIDIIHTNTVYSRLGKIIAEKCNIPHVQHLRELTAGIGDIVNFKFQNEPNKFKSIYGTHDGLIANSNFCLNSNRPWYSSVNEMVMHNSVDDSFFQLPIDKKKNVVGLVANVTAIWKRHDLFIELADIYSKKYGSDLQFVVYGSLPDKSHSYFESLKKDISSNNLNGIIKFAGSIDSKKIYREIKVLVHTCSTEPFGRIFIEAAASGVPILAIKGGGATEIVNNNIGFLFSDKKLEEMADKLHQLVNSESKRLAVSETARIEAKKYLPETTYKNLILFYKKILNFKS
jgi:L-malate glycosyltransferase